MLWWLTLTLACAMCEYARENDGRIKMHAKKMHEAQGSSGDRSAVRIKSAMNFHGELKRPAQAPSLSVLQCTTQHNSAQHTTTAHNSAQHYTCKEMETQFSTGKGILRVDCYKPEQNCANFGISEAVLPITNTQFRRRKITYKYPPNIKMASETTFCHSMWFLAITPKTNTTFS